MMGRNFMITIAELCVIGASVIAFFAIQMPGPVLLLTFLWAVAALVLAGALLWLGVTVTDFLGRRGSSKVRFPPGETIFRQGDKGDFIYKIDDGEVEVIREDPKNPAQEGKVLARLGPGEFFGEAALISDAPRNATVRTLTAVNAMRIPRDDFSTLYAHLPDFRHKIETLAQER
jgi:Cyclic nucleotide-binding domain